MEETLEPDALCSGIAGGEGGNEEKAEKEENMLLNHKIAQSGKNKKIEPDIGSGARFTPIPPEKPSTARKRISFSKKPKNLVPATLDPEEIHSFKHKTKRNSNTIDFENNGVEGQSSDKIISQPVPAPGSHMLRPRVKKKSHSKTQEGTTKPIIETIIGHSNDAMDPPEISIQSILVEEQENKVLSPAPAFPVNMSILDDDQKETEISILHADEEEEKKAKSSCSSPIIKRRYVATIDEAELILPGSEFQYQNEIATQLKDEKKKRKKRLNRKYISKKLKEKEELEARIAMLEKQIQATTIDDRIADLESVIEELRNEVFTIDAENQHLNRVIEKLRSQQDALLISDHNLAQELRRNELMKSQLADANNTINELNLLVQSKDSEISANQILLSHFTKDGKEDELKGAEEKEEVEEDNTIMRMIAVFDGFVAEKAKFQEQITKEKKEKKKLCNKITEMTSLLQGYEKCESDRQKSESRLSLCRDRVTTLEQQCRRLTKENESLRKMVIDGGRLAARKEHESLLKEIKKLRKENHKLHSLPMKTKPLYEPTKRSNDLNFLELNQSDSETPPKNVVVARLD